MTVSNEPERRNKNNIENKSTEARTKEEKITERRRERVPAAATLKQNKKMSRTEIILTRITSSGATINIFEMRRKTHGDTATRMKLNKQNQIQ